MIKPNFLFKSFSDNSGTVFFNTVSGETIAFELNSAEIQAVLAGEHSVLSDTTAVSELSKVMSLPTAVLSHHNADE